MTMSQILMYWLGIALVFAGKTTSEFFSDLSLPSIKSEELSEAQIKPPRLLQLLELKESLSNILPDTLDSSNSNVETSRQFGDSSVSKRVFCNGFTGCGGRFRGRRRQQPSANVSKRLVHEANTKRPFCNTNGCFNGKRSTEADTEYTPYEQQVTVPAAKVPAFDDGWTGGKLKRLFCNGYGGCNNFGKRSRETLAAAVAQEYGDVRQRLQALSARSLGKLQKKYFSSDFDSSMDAAINGMGR